MTRASSVALISYDAIPESVWSKLSHAANDPAQILRLMAVATVTPDGRPSNRTLVLRGADRASGVAWFYSDRRAPKVRHLNERPYVSALGYDEHDRAQIRLDGFVTLHHDDMLAQRHWEQVSMAVRHAYGWAHAPGEPLQPPDPQSQLMHHQQESGQSDRGRQNFVVIQVHVETIDWLQIGDAGQIRAILRANSGWKAEPVAP